MVVQIMFVLALVRHHGLSLALPLELAINL